MCDSENLESIWPCTEKKIPISILEDFLNRDF